MKPFLRKLIIFTVIILATDATWDYIMPAYAIPHVGFMLTFFFMATLFFHRTALQYSEKKPQAFVRFYMTGTLIRMLLCVVIILIYRVMDKDNIMTFAIGFMMHYLAFTFFEVSALLKQLKA